MRHAWLLLVLAGAAACTSFDPLDREVCGNGVVEAGEDCDSRDASCVRCAVTCEAASDCPNAAYTCGTDGLCHAPGGVLAPPATAGPFQVNDFAITDLGQDGTGDVVGLSRTSISVRPGDASGLLSRAISIVTPFQTGRPAFADMDGDGSLDLTLSTPDGVVTYASPLGELTPLPSSNALEGGGDGFELVALYRISNVALGAFISTPQGAVLVAVFDLADMNLDEIVLPCGADFRASAFDDGSFDINRLSPDDATTTDLLLAISGPTLAGSNRTCLLGVNKAPNRKATFAELTPAQAVALPGHAILADVDLDADSCPALLSTTANGIVRQFDGTRAGASCTFAAAGTNIDLGASATPGATLVGRIKLTPPVAFLAPDVIVMTDGVYANVANTFVKAYASTRKIARVDVGDMNGDGRVDAVVASAGEDDIDILYRTEQVGYQLVRLDTASRVTSLTVGDYDGNGIADIAYTELIDSFQRLEVAYSTADRPLAPVAMGVFPAEISSIRFSIADSVDQGSLADDLAVLTVRTGVRPPTVSFFHGSPQRTMMPYSDPLPEAPNTFALRPFQLRGAVVGNFDGDGYADIAGIGGATSVASSAVRAWLMKGSIVGPDPTASAGKGVAGLSTCAGSASGVCVEDSLFMTLPGPGRDFVLAIDRADPPHAAVIDPASVNTNLVAAPSELGNGVPAGSVLRSAFTFDLDGDDGPELVAAFAPRARTTGQGAIRRCALSAGMIGSCEDLTSEILAAVDGATACVDAAVGHFGYRDAFSDARGEVDLVVLCQGPGGSMIERVSQGKKGREIVELARVPEVLEALRIGDVTGDGVDDIAAISVALGAETLEVFRQCSSRDARACTGGGQ